MEGNPILPADIFMSTAVGRKVTAQPPGRMSVASAAGAGAAGAVGAVGAASRRYFGCLRSIHLLVRTTPTPRSSPATHAARVEASQSENG